MAVLTPWLQMLEPLTEPPPAWRPVAEAPAPAPVPPDLDALRAEADAVLVQARAEAAEMLEDAGVQAEALREAAWQEGHHQGKTEAQAAVEAELRAAWDARRDALRAELENIVAEIGATRQALWARQESEMVALSLDIARQVVKTEVTQNPEVVRALIANALRRLTDKDNVRVRVSLADAPRIKEARQDLMEMVDGLRHLEIVDDRRVGEGGCVIETNAGTIDAKIETQLAEVARALGVTESG
jgi:flagellar assembly protein FliH